MLCGCVIPMSPLSNESRLVTPLTNQTAAVVFKESMVFYDRAFAPSHGIRFPEGRYVLEAEDREYRYYRAPTNIEYRVFANGIVSDGRFMPGGLFLGKQTLKVVPAGAYLSSEGNNTNMVTWKLGGEFLRLEGAKWHRE